MARALYVIDDGWIPPDFNYMDGFLYPKPAHLPYIADRPVPTFPDAATTIYGDNETVQFGAFLSTIYGLQAGQTYKNGDQTMVPAPAPGVVVPAVFGTTTPADFSPVISVTWGAPSVGSTITLTASNLHPSAAGDKVTFTAVASGMPSGDYLYVCAIPGGSGSLKVKGPGPMLAGPSQSTTISGWASGDGTSADFIAFESPFGEWSNCWSSPYFPGDSLYSVPIVSNIVPVNWPAGPKKIYWFPT